ncbi:peptidylprolyl isomerase [Leptolyngbya sp. FACHB-261]|uniref:peptidylprolyl isomerase n=1 Tax=Leptolyngbya sp. FACHB-261 TaxID=2692806 RepID=UPI001687EFE6|nr:peptidylprolyl isomerase [Leptolyngbya sp. FACHB-261]MBD2101480.1 peptidylprolyl isomerase [Leptolyngbya sp. FACHB-261]
MTSPLRTLALRTLPLRTLPLRTLVLVLVLVLSLSLGSCAEGKNLARRPGQVPAYVPGEVSDAEPLVGPPPESLRPLYPWLEGRAEVRLTTSNGHTLLVEVYGDHAPLTAGNFVDLVNRGYYNGTPLIVDERFILRAAAEPFIDPTTGQERRLPLEIQPEGASQPIYGRTFAEAGLPVNALPVLKNSYRGALALSHPEGEANTGSARFFISYGNGEVIPYDGNALDGFYSVFGYVIDGVKYGDPDEPLQRIQNGEKIVKAEVVAGLENLHLPGET